MQYTDLRDWIQKVDELGELRRVDRGGLEPRDGRHHRGLRAQRTLSGNSVR